MYMIIQANEKQAAEKEKSTEQKVQEQQSKDSEKLNLFFIKAVLILDYMITHWQKKIFGQLTGLW
jgi:hypothetical protein